MFKCAVCGSNDFYKISGYLFCTTCQTQSQDAGEEVEIEFPIESNVRLRKTKIRSIKIDKTDEELGWTSWELYNFVLIGLTNELIELGVSHDIKVTVLQLWARYLGKLEIAFISANKKQVPKLSRRYKIRDAEIIYGKVLSQKRGRKRKANSLTESIASTYPNEEASTKQLNRNKKLMINADYDRYVQSQISSEGDAVSSFSQSVYSVQSSGKQSCDSTRIEFNSFAKKETTKVKNMAKKIPKHKRGRYKQSHVTTRYKTGPESITPTKLWAILYLALRIHKQDIHLSDMIRYGREGHLSYYKLDHLVPPEISLTNNDIKFLSRAADITHKGMRSVIGRMAKFLGVRKIICPDLLSLVNRYCTELVLPENISSYVERLVSLSSPKMTFDKVSYIPNYEGRAMAFIIVVLKTLLCLDGITENELSNVAEKINSAISDEGLCDIKLFNFREWQRYIECRKAVLINAHYPTKLKYNSNLPDVNSLYIRFLESVGSKSDREKPEIITYKHLIPRDIAGAMKECITSINEIDLPLNEVNEFSPTLTPSHSYLQQLLEHPLYDLPSMLRKDYSLTKSGYLTKPKSIYKLALQYNIQLNSIDSNLHFIEKAVPLFEQAKITSVKDLKDNNVVENCKEVDIKNLCLEKREDFLEYLHKKIPCRVNIDLNKRQLYDSIRNTIAGRCEKSNSELPSTSASTNEFIFNEILPDGKLPIPDRRPSDNESEDNDARLKDNTCEQTQLLSSEFCKTYNTSLSSVEMKALTLKELSWSKKRKRKLVRNASGKFVKQDDTCFDIESPSKGDCYTKETELNSADTSEVRNPEIFSSSINAFVSDNFAKVDGRSTVDESLYLSTESPNSDNVLKLFRPFKDYWMYHCNFSRVKSKNFELLEKMLPRSFRWLLNESASIVEMSTEDLYEEVCLVEGYYAYVLEQSKVYSQNVTSRTEQCSSRAYINTILKKW
ncbi:hypothetical protein PUN28_011105 [Cardiocondyla obscurior]|uniref:Rrn7/TAF1B C-terminal cyclin domain-containing protein n=1 Tax=Cardiocondyla obscurior TaxID=286306 RepID=A0AAW2FQ60_9HYME